MSLYYESVDKLKIYGVKTIIGKTILSFSIIWCLNMLLVRMLTTVIKLEFCS